VPKSCVTIDQVRESYKAYYQAENPRKSNSARLPELLDGKRPSETWDPFVWHNRKPTLEKGLLDKEKVTELKKQLDVVISYVPKGEDWKSYCEEKALCKDDLRKVFQLVFGSNRSATKQLTNGEDTDGSILEVGFRLLGRAQILKGEAGTHRRAASLARLVGHILLVVSEATEGGHDSYQEQVSPPTAVYIHAINERSWAISGSNMRKLGVMPGATLLATGVGR
jgi:hypothetical protein